MTPPTPLEVQLRSLDAQDVADQTLRDRVHQRLNERCQLDPETGCWIYTGNWDDRGTSRVRVGVRTYTLTRVAAWLYVAGFELWDARWVYHLGVCPNPACFNPEHLAVAADRAAAQAAMRAIGRYGSAAGRGQAAPGRRFSLDEARLVRGRLLNGEEAALLARELGVRVQAIRRIADGRSWPEEGKPPG
jgi:hypothetical protein